MRARPRRLTLAVIALEAFLAIGALQPGWSFIRDPSGKGLGMDTAWLKGAPFHDYLIPGLFLFFIIGLGNGLLATFSWKHPQLAARGALGMGLFLSAWIGCQWAWLEPKSWLQSAILGLGLLLFVLGLALERKWGRR